MFKKKKLKNLILNKSKIINGSVCIDEGKTFKRNNYEFFRYKNKFCPAYNKHVIIQKKIIFEDLKNSKLWFLRILELWLIKIPSFSIAYIVRFSKKCIYGTIKRSFLILIENFYKNNNYVGGEDEVSEIDEFKFSKRKNNKSHPVDGVWIFGLVERQNKKGFIISS